MDTYITIWNAQKNLSWVGWNFIQVTGWHFFAGWSAGKPLLAMAREMWDSEQPVAPTFKDALLAPTSALFTYTISTFNSNKFIKFGTQTLLTAIWTKYIYKIQKQQREVFILYLIEDRRQYEMSRNKILKLIISICWMRRWVE